MDIVLTIINAITTVIAVISANQSWKYYKKSRALADHTNMSKALVGIEKMLCKLPEALSVTNKNRQKKGINFDKIIGNIGADLNSFYLEIHSCVPSAYASELFKLENEGGFELRKYINGYISGEVLNKGMLDSEDYAKCQTQLMKMQENLKKSIEEMPEKI